jgi:hypothetical protein
MVELSLSDDHHVTRTSILPSCDENIPSLYDSVLNYDVRHESSSDVSHRLASEARIVHPDILWESLRFDCPAE